VINDKFPPEQAVLASQNETRLVSVETWTCQYHIRIYKNQMHIHTVNVVITVLYLCVKYLIWYLLQSS